MFQSTLRKLTVVNSLVFFILFVIFGVILYGQISYRLFDKVDDAMQYKAESIKFANGRPSFINRNRLIFDPRIFILLRTESGQIIDLFPFQTEEFNHLQELAQEARLGEIQAREVEGHMYRILSIPYQQGDSVFITDKGPARIQEIISVSIVDSEVALLNNILYILAGALIIGMLIIILAGYYLARRAMIPIRSSWDRQQQFVADASHELRSPLAVIKSNAELMLRHPDHSVQEESIRITNIIRESLRMTKLVSSLLTLARADASQAELQLASVPLPEVVDSVVSQFRPLAEMKGLSLEIAVPESLNMLADKERIQQLLVILLDNSLKYTSEGGKILLQCRKQNEQIVIAVEDTGVGISAEDLPRIFDRFFRADKARSRESGGIGLGLAIASWIVEKHGGSIRAESKPSEGTRIHIVFPAK